MYSKNARWKVLLEYEVPMETMQEIARQHQASSSLAVDYYYLPWKGLVAVIDGKGATQVKGYHKGVDGWRWEQMQDMKIEVTER